MNTNQAIDRIVNNCPFSAHVGNDEVRRVAELYVNDAVARDAFSNDSIDVQRVMVLIAPSYTPWYETSDGMPTIAGLPGTAENVANFFRSRTPQALQQERLEAADNFGPAMANLLRAI